MHYKEQIMDLKPGDVVMLKSGGHPLSVVEVKDGNVVCVWMGNEGDVFPGPRPLCGWKKRQASSRGVGWEKKGISFARHCHWWCMNLPSTIRMTKRKTTK